MSTIVSVLSAGPDDGEVCYTYGSREALEALGLVEPESLKKDRLKELLNRFPSVAVIDFSDEGAFA